jgi:hypothetical protein
MKKEYRKHTLSQNEHLKNAIERTHVASVNECTGITPIVPDSDYEADSYESLMEIPVTARHKEKDKGGIESG